MLFAGYEDGGIRVWDLAYGKQLGLLQSHKCSVTAMSLEGHTLFSASSDGVVVMWNLRTGAVVQQFDLRSPVMSMFVANDVVMCVTEHGVKARCVNTVALQMLAQRFKGVMNNATMRDQYFMLLRAKTKLSQVLLELEAQERCNEHRLSC